jgi:hypothetical protein
MKLAKGKHLDFPTLSGFVFALDCEAYPRSCPERSEWFRWSGGFVYVNRRVPQTAAAPSGTAIKSYHNQSLLPRRSLIAPPEQMYWAGVEKFRGRTWDDAYDVRPRR